MSDNMHASNANRGLRQEQPRRAPARGRNMVLYYVIGVLVVLTLAVGGLYLFKPSWLPFGGEAGLSLRERVRIVFDGRAGGINAGQGNTVTQGPASGENPTVIIRSSQINARPGGTTQGAFVKLTPEVAAELNGKRARVTVWARAAQENPSNLFGVAYSRAGAGTTGWVAFEPGKEMKAFSFAYRVPDVPAGKTSPGDFVGIWADVTGQNGGLEVQRIAVIALPLPKPRKPQS
ncbi:MAG: hypothetical protein ACT4OG_03520 [Alphaproteobacteria bacterium]